MGGIFFDSQCMLSHVIKGSQKQQFYSIHWIIVNQQQLIVYC